MLSPGPLGPIRRIKPLRDMRNVPEWALAQKSEENELRYHVHRNGHGHSHIHSWSLVGDASGNPNPKRRVV